MPWLCSFTDLQPPNGLMEVAKNHLRGPNMLYTLVAVLLILWLLGMVGSFTLGGAIHLLLVVALVLIVLNLVQGRRVL
jgi:hypothetical protein